MLSRRPVNLSKRWITKPLHMDTFTQIIIDSNPSTAHRLYMLTNDLEHRQEFLELEKNDKICITAVVTTNHGYAKEARAQVEFLKWMRIRVLQRPEFSVKLYIYDRRTMLELFSFKHTTTNEKEVYRLIDRLEEKVINMI